MIIKQSTSSEKPKAISIRCVGSINIYIIHSQVGRAGWGYRSKHGPYSSHSLFEELCDEQGRKLIFERCMSQLWLILIALISIDKRYTPRNT